MLFIFQVLHRLRLNYLTHTRPDIMYSVAVLSRFMHSPTSQHLVAAKRVLRYVAGTLDFGLWYTSNSCFELEGFSDSDWGSCIVDRRSTTGYVFSMGSAAVSWCSKKQGIVALSSSEAEYLAISAATCQVLWLKKMLRDIGRSQDGGTIIWCDNQSAIAMTKNPAFHNRTKHIDIRHHFVRSQAEKGEIRFEYCHTSEQVADILTKSLPQAKYEYLRSKLGVCAFASRGSVESVMQNQV